MVERGLCQAAGKPSEDCSSAGCVQALTWTNGMQGEDLNYFGVQGLRIAGGQGIAIICICQACFASLQSVLRSGADRSSRRPAAGAAHVWTRVRQELRACSARATGALPAWRRELPRQAP